MASAPPEPGTPPRAPESREAVRADRLKSREPEPSSTAELSARSAPGAETPRTSHVHDHTPAAQATGLTDCTTGADGSAPPEPPPDSSSSVDSSRRAYPLPPAPSAEAPPT